MFHESDRAVPQRTPALHLVADIADYGDQSDDCGDDPRHGTRQQGKVQPVLRCGPCPFRRGDDPRPGGHRLGLERNEEHGRRQYAERCAQYRNDRRVPLHELRDPSDSCPQGVDAFSGKSDDPLQRGHGRNYQRLDDPVEAEQQVARQSEKRGPLARGRLSHLFGHAVELAPGLRRRIECLCHHLGRDLAFLHLLFQHADGFSCLAGNFRQRIESGIDHLQQILPHQPSRRGHLREGQRQ